MCFNYNAGLGQEDPSSLSHVSVGYIDVELSGSNDSCVKLLTLT